MSFQSQVLMAKHEKKRTISFPEEKVRRFIFLKRLSMVWYWLSFPPSLPLIVIEQNANARNTFLLQVFPNAVSLRFHKPGLIVITMLFLIVKKRNCCNPLKPLAQASNKILSTRTPSWQGLLQTETSKESNSPPSHHQHSSLGGFLLQP